jgi:hypothetical protein
MAGRNKEKHNPNEKWTNKYRNSNGYSNAHREEIIGIEPKQPSIDNIDYFEKRSITPGRKNPRVKPNRYYDTPPEYTI